MVGEYNFCTGEKGGKISGRMGEAACTTDEEEQVFAMSFGVVEFIR